MDWGGGGRELEGKGEPTERFWKCLEKDEDLPGGEGYCLHH